MDLTLKSDGRQLLWCAVVLFTVAAVTEDVLAPAQQAADNGLAEDLSEAGCLAVNSSRPSTTWHVPSFQELHHRLFGHEADPADNATHVVINFTNPYSVKPAFNNYPHSNLLPELFSSILDTVRSVTGGPHFIVEVGSLHGHSAIMMATVLDQVGLSTVPLLCVDPFTGDVNMWANHQTDRSVNKWVNIKDGRILVFDQFMANVQFAISRSISQWHILPLHGTSIIGARWLEVTGYQPDLIFLDSAHEEHETLLEISLFFRVLAPGGVLFGDDYGWEAVRKDVHRFVDRHNAAHGEKFPVVLKIVPAKAGTTNLLWIMQKAKV